MSSLFKVNQVCTYGYIDIVHRSSFLSSFFLSVLLVPLFSNTYSCLSHFVLNFVLFGLDSFLLLFLYFFPFRRYNDSIYSFLPDAPCSICHWLMLPRACFSFFAHCTFQFWTAAASPLFFAMSHHSLFFIYVILAFRCSLMHVSWSFEKQPQRG